MHGRFAEQAAQERYKAEQKKSQGKQVRNFKPHFCDRPEAEERIYQGNYQE